MNTIHESIVFHYECGGEFTVEGLVFIGDIIACDCCGKTMTLRKPEPRKVKQYQTSTKLINFTS